MLLVELDTALVAGHYLLHEHQRLLVHARVVDQDFTDIGAQVVANGADNNVTLLVNQEGGRARVHGLNGIPKRDQVIQVPLQLFGAATNACGTYDGTHAIGDVDARQRFLQLSTIIAFNAAGNAAGTGIVRHQYQVAAREADKGRECGTLVATLFLIDLNDDFGAFLEHFLDAGALAAFRLLAEVFSRDLLQRQKAVTLGTEINKGGFKAGLDTGNAAFVDVGLLLFAAIGFDVEVKQALAVNQRNAQLFRLSCVDEHSFHVVCVLINATLLALL